LHDPGAYTKSLSYGVHACTRKEPLDRKAYLLYSLETYVSTHRPDEFKVARVGVLYFGLDIFLLFFLWPQVLDYYTFLFSAKCWTRQATFSTFGQKSLSVPCSRDTHSYCGKAGPA